MIDRRFLDIRITINGFAAAAPSGPKRGDQWIVSKAWGDQYPNAVVDSIAKYSDKWSFTKPNDRTSALEVINLETQEILKYCYDDDKKANAWVAVASLGGVIYPFVVDKVYSKTAPENTLDKVGEVYIITDLDGDTNVYQITGTGEKGRKSLGVVSLNQKVAVIENGLIYTVNSKTVDEAEVNYFTSNGYVPINSLVHSLNTQTVYLSPASTGRDLISLTPQISTAGENQGTLTVVAHTFTAEEVANKKVVFNDKVDTANLNRVMCFIGGNVCVHGVDFIAEQYSTNSDKRLVVNGNDSYKAWYANFPSVDEVGIFMYFKN